METLRFGSTGNNVTLLQLALARAGYYKFKIDGIFGTRTLNAVRRFQSSNGLAPDGIAGPNTWDKAEKYLYGFFTLRLRPGDTFFRLAKRYGTTADAIAAANPGMDPSNLPVGGEIIVPYGFPVTPTDVPWSSDLLEYVVRGLTVRYPFIQLETIGQTPLLKPIRVLRMGNGRREVFINAAHHANEWITSPLVTDYLESFASAYVNNRPFEGQSAASLFASVTLYVAPMVNPDGVDLVNGAVSREAENAARRIADDYPEISFPSGWKANIRGVDPNLSYPAGWDEAKAIKFEQGFTTPAPRDFVGDAPLAAPESRAVCDFTRTRDFAVTVSYHTQGEEIYYKYLDKVPEGAEELAKKMAEVSGYAAADVPFRSGFAGYKDWFIQDYDRPGFTVEAGRGVNPLPLSQYPRIREENFPLMTVALSDV
ncbi:MAG: peptidoglycan-binding protein [Clostridiales bacterium]|nr:peptidoglycan-binding protein [Clostridiales bacterium]